MSIRISDVYRGVPGGWWVVDPNTGAKIQDLSYKTMKHAWISHRKANNLTWDKVEDWIHEQICARVPNYCGQSRNPPISQHGVHRLPIAVLLANFTTEIMKWAAAGFVVNSRAVTEARVAACRACSFWDENAAFGVGKCNACGCSGIKHHIKTSKCPKGKWAE